MPQKYFDKFPIVNYSNNNVVDITRRTVLLERVSTDPLVFYPYEISSDERADQLSHRYYEDPYRSWILYLSNKIVDPYHEWYLSNDEFEEFVVKKYGSYVNAVEKIKYYRNNWENVEDIDSDFWNALPKTLQNYWEPKIGVNNRITGYKRKQIDWKTTTNKIVSYTTNNANYIVDEIVDIVFDTYNKGRGQVLTIKSDSANTANTTVYLQHMSGSFITDANVGITASSYLYGRESTVNSIFTAVSSCANNLSEEELSYWKPVSYWEHENEKNEFNKTVRVLDSNFKQTISDNLRDLLRT